MIEREQLFKEHIVNLRKGGVQGAKKQSEINKEAFVVLLEEQTLAKDASWRKVSVWYF
jgi:hypothetical protein